VRSAEATIASREQAGQLGVTAGSALLRLRSVSREAGDRPIEFFIAYHRGDRSRFEFQLREEDSHAALLHVSERGSATPTGSSSS
jgi:GntR family transcriptional regulator